MRHAYLATDSILVAVALLAFAVQCYVWFRFGDWSPALMSIIWAHIGIGDPGGDLSLTGVFGLLGGWLLWEGHRRTLRH